MGSPSPGITHVGTAAARVVRKTSRSRRGGARRLLSRVEARRGHLRSGQSAARDDDTRHGGGGGLFRGAAEIPREVIEHEVEELRVGGGGADAQTGDDGDVRPGSRRRGFRDRRLRRGRGETDLVRLELAVGDDAALGGEDDAGDELVDVRGGSDEFDARALVLEDEGVVVGDKLGGLTSEVPPRPASLT